ncbi:MAG: hypothetical protein IT331_09445 [Anaerolineae bacterium]|nr:hypothetical protein [Anaerolineae bacterium]
MQKYRREIAVLAAFLILTLVLTYPLALNFTTHVAGDGSDDPALAWNLWWVPYALLDAGTNPIYTDYMFYPIGLNLGFYTLTYLNAFLAVPLQFGFGLIPAANVNLVMSFTLSGFGMYLLAYYMLGDERRRTKEEGRTKDEERTTDDEGRFGAARFETKGERPESLLRGCAAFAAGLVYAFAASKFLYASLGQFNIASSQWIPFYVLFLIKLFDTPKPPYKYGVMLAVFLLAQALSEFIFASFLILFTIAYFLYWLVTIRFRVFRYKQTMLNLGLAALAFAVTMAPILTAMVSDILAEGDFIQQGLGFANIFSADLLGFFVPSHLHPLFGGLEAQFHFPYINFMYLGFVALALGIVAVWKVKAARIWGVWALVFGLIALGPTLRLGGAEFDLPMPFDALLDIPLIKGNRYPSRWSVMLTLALAVLVGYGMAWVLGRIADGRWRTADGRWRTADGRWRTADGRWRTADGGRQMAGSGRLEARDHRTGLLGVATVLGAVILFENLATPMPLSDFRVPEIYSQIRQEVGNFSVMELPLTWRNGFRVTGSYRNGSQGPIDRIFMLAQWYQTTQQHPILNGNTSRNPELKFQYFAEAPVLDSLIAIQTGHAVDAATRERDKELAPRVLDFFGTRFVIWHAPFEEENRDVADRTRTYIEEVLPLTKISESYENGRGLAVYRVNETEADDTLVLRPNDPLARLYLGEGWGALGGDAFWVERNATKLFLPISEPRDMKLTLNDLRPYPPQGQGLAVRVNGTDIGHVNPIPIENGAYNVTLPTRMLRSGVNTVELTFDETVPVTDLSDSKVSIVVRSAGEEQGAFGHIFVNGVDESPNARGYNVVVIEPKTGQVQARENFDTFLSEREAARMAQFLNRVAEGDLVAVAASDEASEKLTAEAVEALRTIGAREDLRGKFRWSHAVIGVKGALPGSASEMASETEVSQVWLNVPLTAPQIAASVGVIRVEPVE